MLKCNAPAMSGSFADPIVPGEDASGVDPATAVVTVDQVNVTNLANVTPEGFSYTPAAALADGPHSVAVQVKDRCGNQASASATFTIDTVAPAIANLTPANGAFVRGTKPVISASHTDAGTGINVASARLTVNGADVTAAATVTATGISYTPTDALAEGKRHAPSR